MNITDNALIAKNAKVLANVNITEYAIIAKNAKVVIYVNITDNAIFAKECKGSSVCEHNRRRNICKEC